MLRHIARTAVIGGALAVTLAVGSAAQAAATTWSASKDYGKATASFTASGNLKLSVTAQDTKGDSTGVSAEVKIVSGDKTTDWGVVNQEGNGNAVARSKTFDGGNIGFSGHVQVRICKFRSNNIPGGVSWGCSSWKSRSYSL